MKILIVLLIALAILAAMGILGLVAIFKFGKAGATAPSVPTTATSKPGAAAVAKTRPDWQKAIASWTVWGIAYICLTMTLSNFIYDNFWGIMSLPHFWLGTLCGVGLLIVGWRAMADQIDTAASVCKFIIIFSIVMILANGISGNRLNVPTWKKYRAEKAAVEAVEQTKNAVMVNEVRVREVGDMIELSFGKHYFKCTKGEKTKWVHSPDGRPTDYTFYTDNYIIEYRDGTKVDKSKGERVPRFKDEDFRFLALNDLTIELLVEQSTSVN